MARNVGDKNHSLREERLKAENAALKAKIESAKADARVKVAKLAELRDKLRQAKTKK